MTLDSVIRVSYITDRRNERTAKMTFFSEYRDAFNAACDMARARQREMGLEKVTGPLEKGFRVISLPNPENRRGFELRCQVVTPSEPKMI